MEQKQESELKERIEKLRAGYERLKSLCAFGARLRPETIESYAKEIQQLQAQLNN